MIEINNVKFYVFKSSIFTFIVVNIQLSIEINVSIKLYYEYILSQIKVFIYFFIHLCKSNWL